MKILLLTITLIASCISSSPNTSTTITPLPTVNKTTPTPIQKEKPAEKGHSIKIGKVLAVPNENIKIKFIDVLEDSRCPTGARCVWAGNAKVKIEVEQNNETKTIELNSTVSPTEMSHAGYKIGFLDLSPYPDLSKQTNKAEYVVNLDILKASK